MLGFTINTGNLGTPPTSFNNYFICQRWYNLAVHDTVISMLLLHLTHY